MYSNKMFDDAHNEAESERKKLAKESNLRKGVAYGFKIIAVIGGIILTTGVSEGTAQVLGISISIVIAIDLIFSNHKRMLIVSKANKGLELFLNDLRFEYNKSIQDVVNLKDTNKVKAKETLDSINAEFATRCHVKTQEVRTAIAEADLKFLENLSVESESNK